MPTFLSLSMILVMFILALGASRRSTPERREAVETSVREAFAGRTISLWPFSADLTTSIRSHTSRGWREGVIELYRPEEIQFIRDDLFRFTHTSLFLSDGQIRADNLTLFERLPRLIDRGAKVTVFASSKSDLRRALRSATAVETFLVDRGIDLLDVEIVARIDPDREEHVEVQSGGHR